MRLTRFEIIFSAGLFIVLLLTVGWVNAAPQMAVSLPEGRNYDQAHDTGYIDWSGAVGYVYLTHRDMTSLPVQEGGASCEFGCQEWVSRLWSGGMASGSFTRDVSVFEVMVAISPDSNVGSITLRACSEVSTWNTYLNSGNWPGFVSMPLTVPSGCRSWSISATGGYVDFRSVDVYYMPLPPTSTPSPTIIPTMTPTATRTSAFTFTPTKTRTQTFTPTSTRTSTPSRTPSTVPSPTLTFTLTRIPSSTSTKTLVPTSSPTMTNTASQTPTWTPSVTPSPTVPPSNTPTSTLTASPMPTQTSSFTPTPLPPSITGRILCNLWGDDGWCRGKAGLELTASDPQGYTLVIQGDLQGNFFQCEQACILSLPKGVGTAKYRVISASGLSADGSSEWKQDGIPPILNVFLPAIDGMNGWYISPVDIRVDASDSISGVRSVKASLDGEEVQIHDPFQLADGLHLFEVTVRDMAGNESIKRERLLIDTTSPISAFTSHTNGETVSGDVNLTGNLMDELSGILEEEISLDGGATWYTVLIDTGGAWSFTWHTREVPNGEYRVQTRGRDRAGNPGHTIELTLVVDNTGPHVSLTDRWWIWDAGLLEVHPNSFPVIELRVSIRDLQDRWPQVRMEFDPRKNSHSITWDRHFSNGTLAPSGEYQVLAVACDVHGLCGSDTGWIHIPIAATLTSIPSLTPTMFATLVLPSTHTPGPDHVAPNPIPRTPTRGERAETRKSNMVPYWPLAGLLGLFLVLASVSMVDPRPAALNRLRQRLKAISECRVGDGSDIDRLY